jgi:hypothetical protein
MNLYKKPLIQNAVQELNMKYLSKFITAALILVMVASSMAMMAETAFAEVQKPSIPEFTIKLVAYPYDILPSASVDPYTGKTTTSPGQHIDNRSLEMTIKNQGVPPSTTGEPYILGYSIRMKGHFETDSWTELYYWNNGTDFITFLPQSENEFTLFSQQPAFPPDSQVDFQVEAVLGHRVITQILRTGMWPFDTVDHPIFIIDATSDWSDSQTVTITPPNSATNDSFSWIAAFFESNWMQAIVALLVVIAILLVFVVFYLRKRSRIA